MLERNLEEQTQMVKEHNSADKNLFSKVIEKIMSEREGVLSFPESFDDAVTTVVNYVQFGPVHKSIVEDGKVSDVKEEFFIDESGKILMGYKLGGVGVKSDIDDDDWLITVIRQFIITPESELLVLEATEKSRYCEECDFRYRTLKCVRSENQTLSNWEKEYLFDELIWKIKIWDSFNQLEEEIRNYVSASPQKTIQTSV